MELIIKRTPIGHVLTCLFDQRRLLINKAMSRFLVAIHQKPFEQSACMISRFNEIIPFDRPPSLVSSAPPWPSFGILWHSPQRETLEPERFNCKPRSDLIVSARSASTLPRQQTWKGRRKCFLKSRRKIRGDMPFDSKKRTVMCAHTSLKSPFTFLSVPLPFL